jgi:AbrB family looped-hinge helix DNA binding protein
MALARSKVTSQGHVSVPAEVRKKLGVGPGSLLEWSEEGGAVVIRRVGKYSSEDIHQALFGKRAQKARSVEAFDEGVRRHLQAKHARR